MTSCRSCTRESQSHPAARTQRQYFFSQSTTLCCSLWPDCLSVSDPHQSSTSAIMRRPAPVQLPPQRHMRRNTNIGTNSWRRSRVLPGLELALCFRSNAKLVSEHLTNRISQHLSAVSSSASYTSPDRPSIELPHLGFPAPSRHLRIPDIHIPVATGFAQQPKVKRRAKIAVQIRHQGPEPSHGKH